MSHFTPEAHARMTQMRELTHSAAGLIEQSVRVEPYTATHFAGLEAA